jgi:hypothetical protein
MFLGEATGAFRSPLIRAVKNLEVVPRLELAPLSTEPFIHDAPDLWPLHAVQPQPLERAPLTRKVLPVGEDHHPRQPRCREGSTPVSYRTRTDYLHAGLSPVITNTAPHVTGNRHDGHYARHRLLRPNDESGDERKRVAKRGRAADPVPIFLASVLGGFGAAKAYGCGLMLIRRARR